MGDGTIRSADPSWAGKIRLPHGEPGASQDEEWCEIKEDGSWERLRFHDYDQIFRRPGLYEQLFYELLRCKSPKRVVSLLADVRADLELIPDRLSALDLGAGNGIVGEELRRVGATSVVGIDILPEAKTAALRDRPTVYDDYVVADLCRLDDATRARLLERRPNCLVSVAALGFGDIPPLAWYNAVELLSDGSLLAFNIKEEFLDSRHQFGFAELIRRARSAGHIRVEAKRRYRHRRSVAGAPLVYTAFVATKIRPVPREMLVPR
jgi:predicted TPR repeat methyltransferase